MSAPVEPEGERAEAAATPPPSAMTAAVTSTAPILAVNNIEVVYNHVILVLKGVIVFDGAEVQALSPNVLVRRGCIQVMEGRHCFAHLTVEENLLTGAFTRRDGATAIRQDLERVYAYFPRIKSRRQ